MDGKAVAQHMRRDVHVPEPHLAAARAGPQEDGLPGRHRHRPPVLRQPQGQWRTRRRIDEPVPVRGGKLIDRHARGTFRWADPQRPVFVSRDRNRALAQLNHPFPGVATKRYIAFDRDKGPQFRDQTDRQADLAPAAPFRGRSRQTESDGFGGLALHGRQIRQFHQHQA